MESQFNGRNLPREALSILPVTMMKVPPSMMMLDDPLNIDARKAGIFELEAQPRELPEFGEIYGEVKVNGRVEKISLSIILSHATRPAPAP
jgi:hypothetical protein